MIQSKIQLSTTSKNETATASTMAVRNITSSLAANIKPGLLKQLRDSMWSRHYSHRTEATYIQWIKGLSIFAKFAIRKRWRR